MKRIESEPKQMPQNLFEALKSEADKGSSEAAYKLAAHYYKGHGIPQDFSEAFKYATIAAQKNYEPAFYLLGMMYRKVKNNKKAFDSMKQSAESNFAPAQFELGEMYLNGLGIEKDFSQGLSWIKKAADQKEGNALVRLGTFALFGIDDFGKKVEPDYEKAFELFKKSAAADNFAGMYYLAEFYNSGLSDEKNEHEARKLFDSILKSSNEYSFVFKALMYEIGTGVEQNLLEAKKYYGMALAFDPGNEQRAKRPYTG